MRCTGSPVTLEDRLLAALGEWRGVAAANRICEACVALLGVRGAAISLAYDGASAVTVGASSTAARHDDEVQFTVGEGPCLEAVMRSAAVVVVDLADPAELRWPRYRPVMLAQGVRSVTALPVIVAGGCVGALDLFGDTPGRVHGKRLATALLAAELAALPILDLLEDRSHTSATDPGATEWTALHDVVRVDVAQATGMLSAQLHVDPAEALVRLRAHAYATGTSASHVARAIIERRLRLDDP